MMEETYDNYAYQEENTVLPYLGHTHPKETIVIIGTGDYGKALSTYMSRRGLNVVLGSRNPEKHRWFDGATVLPTKEALQKGDIVFLAIPASAFSKLDSTELGHKIVIDVSNRLTKRSQSQLSMAESLQEHLPWSRVVKALNTVSAYALQSGEIKGSKEVPICSNYTEATEKVAFLLRKLGFTPIDYGDLSSAKSIEDIPFSFFTGWVGSAITSLVLCFTILWFIIFRRQICYMLERDMWSWKRWYSVPVKELCFAIGNVSLIYLAACYFPGVIASYIQLFRGTKYSRFPGWLDHWLKIRKPIGVISLLYGSIHACYCFTLFGSYDEEDWRKYVYMSAGFLALALMAIVGITSLPSVGASLTWREFSFIQRYFGWWCLFLATAHVLFLKWRKLIENHMMCVVLPDEDQIIIIFPLLTLVLKLPLLFPPINSYLMKIRRGYEKPRKTYTV